MANPNSSTIIRLLIVIAALYATSVQAEPPRTVTVTGSATTRAEPDIAQISMDVVQRSPAPAEAQQEAASVTERTLQLLDELGIERKHVNTTGTSIRPDYRWNQETREQQLIGYIAERTIQVELQDLAKLGDLLEGAVKAGVNQVQPPVLDSSRRPEIHRDTLAQAAEDARANASTLAKSLDATLGRALEINAADYIPQPAPMLRMQANAAMAESAGQSYNAGEIRFDARVNVVFELTGSQ
jgi:uncharacterized protein YggE